MQEFQDIHQWFKGRDEHQHVIIRTAGLPSPTFELEGRRIVSFSSNNYLGLATHPRVMKAAREGLEKYGVANCESRLLGGDMDIYQDLEKKLADLKGKPSALLFATGFLTNVGVLSSLVNCSKMARIYGFKPIKSYKHVFFSDEFNHVSIREGIKLSGCHKVSYRHCDMDNLEEKLKTVVADVKVIVTDGIFSMDGDIAPLPDLITLADRYDALLYVDDAHGTGVIGATGSGITEHFGIDSPRLISMGTLSKAYGALGGFIAAETEIVDLLRFSCSAYGFTSTLPPDQVYAVSESIDVVREESELRDRLWANQRTFVAGVEALGLSVLCKDSAIIPILIGDEGLCEKYSRALAEDGIHVDSIIFPAVPLGKARLRFNMNAKHTPAHLELVFKALKRVVRTHRPS